MEVTAKKLNEDFDPIELKLSFHTKEEVTAMFCIFDHVDISRFLFEEADIDTDKIRDTIDAIMDTDINHANMFEILAGKIKKRC